MADIDPITREALRRASQIQGRTNRSNPPPERPHNPSEEHRGQRHNDRHHHEPPEPEKPRPPETSNQNSGLDALFKDKETSVILILIILLMGEKGSEHLLLALIYLLI